MSTSASLLELLRSRTGEELIEYREFLKDLYSAENLNFWLEVEEFKKLEDFKLLQTTAQQIVKKYLVEETVYEINVPNHLKKQVLSRLEGDVDNKLFDEVQDSIFVLMANDSYPRFLTSERYKEYQVRVALGTPCVGRRITLTLSFDLLETYLRSRSNSAPFLSEHEEVQMRSIRDAKPHSNSVSSTREKRRSIRVLINEKLIGSFAQSKSTEDMMIHYSFRSDGGEKIISGSKVSLDLSVDQFIEKQIRKFNHDSQKNFGLFFVQEKRFLKGKQNLMHYKKQFKNVKNLFEIRSID